MLTSIPEFLNHYLGGLSLSGAIAMAAGAVLLVYLLWPKAKQTRDPDNP